MVNRSPRGLGNQENEQCWTRPCKTRRTWFYRSHKKLTVEYAHQMPSLCPLTHLLSRTSSVHLFHHLLRLPAVCCSLDIGDSTKFSGVSFFSAQCSLNFLWHCSEAKCFFPTQGLNYWSTESCSKECIQCKGSEDLLFISGDCNVNWKFQCKMPIHMWHI